MARASAKSRSKRGSRAARDAESAGDDGAVMVGRGLRDPRTRPDRLLPARQPGARDLFRGGSDRAAGRGPERRGPCRRHPRRRVDAAPRRRRLRAGRRRGVPRRPPPDEPGPPAPGLAILARHARPDPDGRRPAAAALRARPGTSSVDRARLARDRVGAAPDPAVRKRRGPDPDEPAASRSASYRSRAYPPERPSVCSDARAAWRSRRILWAADELVPVARSRSRAGGRGLGNAARRCRARGWRAGARVA